MQNTPGTNSRLSSELEYEGIIRSEALGNPMPNLFEETNVYARSMLVDSGFDVQNRYFDNITPQEQVQMHTTLSKSLQYLLNKDFLKDR